MQIITSLDQLPAPFGPCALTLGNFDGVHLGHRELFRRLVKSARRLDCPAVVCTFNPHPLKFLAPDKAPPLLNTHAEKQRLIAASHVDYLLEIPFTDQFAAMSPEQFVSEVLVGRLNVRALVVGYDYAFGARRRGNADLLLQCGAEQGFAVDVLQPIGADGRPYSSTRIRHLIAAGEVSAVVAQLGRHYNLEGRVVPGDRRGREMGFPTANLETDKDLLPGSGVYAVKVRIRQQEYNAAASLGLRPTFNGSQATIEVHLLDFSGDLYGERMRVYFVERLRGQEKYANAEELSRAIAADVLRARQILQTTSVVQYREYLSLKAVG